MNIDDFDVVVSTVIGSDRLERLHRFFADAGITKYILHYEAKGKDAPPPIPYYNNIAYSAGQHCADILMQFANRNIVFFEDDAILKPDFKDVMNQHLAELPDDWQVFYAGTLRLFGPMNYVSDNIIKNVNDVWGSQCVVFRGAGMSWRTELPASIKNHSIFENEVSTGGSDRAINYWLKKNKVPVYFAAKSFVGQCGCISLILGYPRNVGGLEYYAERKLP